MTRIYADIEALKALRQALLTYANRQAEALDEAEREIGRTQERLAQREEYWRRQVWRRSEELQQCLWEAQRAAAEGYYVDCSGYEYALHQAEEELERVVQWGRRVEEAAAQYRRVARRLISVLENDLPRATGFLADRIAALEAYYAQQVTGAALALVGAGVAGIMGGVIGAIRRSEGQLRRLIGHTGEQIAAQVLSERFGLEPVPFDQPQHGFDRVLRAPGMPLVIMESKVSSSGELHLGQTRAGEQASAEWIADKAARMVDRTSAQWSPANERIGKMVQELGPGNVPAAAVVVNPETGMADVYWRSGGSDWQLLEGD